MANVKLVYLNSTGGYPQPTSATDVAQTLGKLELTGVAGVALDAGAARVSNIATPSSNTDAATKAYVDATAAGLFYTAPVAAVATSAITLSGAQTIDGVSVVTGVRVLVTGQNGSTADAANGIYVANSAGAWSRGALSTDTLKPGLAMFVTQGTTYADTQWVLATDTFPIVPGTTPIIFVQSGAQVGYTAGNGIDITGTTLSAVANTAAGVSVGGSGIAVNADTSTGALQFSGGGALQVNVAAAGGVEISSNALQVKIANADTLSSSASGLDVVGVPSQFEINGSAVSTNVTATNLNVLTDSSTITALHRHANIHFQATATSALVAGDVVYVDGAGTVDKAISTSTTPALVAGVASGSISSSATGAILASGAIAGLSGLTAGATYFLSDTTSGALALYSALTSGNRAIRVGLALSTTALLVNVQDMGVKP